MSVDHVRDYRSGSKEDRIQIGLHDLMPVFRCHIGQKSDVGDAGIIDQKIDLAITPKCLIDQLCGCGFQRNITENGFHIGDAGKLFCGGTQGGFIVTAIYGKVPSMIGVMDGTLP